MNRNGKTNDTHANATQPLAERVTPTRPRWRSIRISPFLFVALGLVIFLGTIQGAKVAGVWTTSGKVDAAGERIAATGADPSEVKGWMTIAEVTAAYGVTTEDIYAQFGIPSDTSPSTALKDLEKVAPDFSITSLREWLTSLH